MNNDIAMIKLARPVKMNNYVSTVCLPSGDVPVGTECYITGMDVLFVKFTGCYARILSYFGELFSVNIIVLTTKHFFGSLYFLRQGMHKLK